MRAFIRTTPWHAERYAWAHELQAKLSGSELVEDDRTEAERAQDPTGYLSLLAALRRIADAGGGWSIEDDAEVTSNFVQRAAWEVQLHPGVILQGYSTEKADLTRGERWRTAWGSNLCVYYPGPTAAALLAFAETWDRGTGLRGKATEKSHLQGADPFVDGFLREGGRCYWQVVPSLANHRANYSVRLGRHYAERRSPTFSP
jgi:hypothetical protein